ncbi:unnamed protein product [Clonostachys solani]|uniref:Gcp-like domain-containing protein n=1 Tax=Clonostachys solani TaxID=160281 RepID=A0A9P0EIX3_9HYPO|nr:unnamed protein product [Clonostachys solani]
MPRTHLAPPSLRKETEDWEEWEDDDVTTPIEPVEQVQMETQAATPGSKSNNRASKQPVVKVKRLKSRHRQKAQNAKAGIKLITDMATLGRQNRGTVWTPDSRPPKFVDAAALRALEGEPTSASVGNWNWFKKNKGGSPQSAAPPASALTLGNGVSPDGQHIMIGLSIDQNDQQIYANNNNNSTNTTTQTPDIRGPSSGMTSTEHLISVWSPDTPTPDTTSSHTFRAVSSVYSQIPNPARIVPSVDPEAPPVPLLPKTYKHMSVQRVKSMEATPNTAEDDDAGTPCTLFEEDASPVPKKQAVQPKSPPLPLKAYNSTLTPDSAASKSRGWWDHVVTPFMDSKRFTFSTQVVKADSPRFESPSEHSPSPPVREMDMDEKRIISDFLAVPVPSAGKPPSIKVPTPRRSPSPRLVDTRDESPGQSSTQTSPVTSDSALGSVQKALFDSPNPSLADQPPPYSPPKKNGPAPVRYRAVFPPGHFLHAQFPPSPRPQTPGSAGLGATMTSQGATPMLDVPITPTVPRDMPEAPPMPLPNRPAGTFVPQEHSLGATGSENKVERQRRRHEKEEVVARRVGGCWRGRGCVPKSGCFGRAGAEGRKRRRAWLGVIIAAILALILIIVLSVMLTRPHSQEVHSIWVNLTDFPPMPTGVLTFEGPDNTASRSGCTEPSTLWSCSLPKEQHDSVSPFKPNQPTIIMQIQWDNSTQKSWNVPNGDAPKSVARRALGGPAHAASVLRTRETNKFTPSPEAPDYKEMWFLGETTDNVTATEKAGEPAPFYISILDDASKPVENPVLSKRQTTIGDGNFIKNYISAPDLLEDGTPAPAVLFPKPVQQPVRLYDRGLSTERYAFYTYFKRTIYLKSTAANNRTEEPVPLDEEGGCAKTEANYLATWSQTRMLVQIWTKRLDQNNVKLLGNGSRSSSEESDGLSRPGTMPYPVTVTLDTHGGNQSSCDDTGVAILTRNHDGSPDSKGPAYSLPFNEFISSDHREFRGIEPLVAVKGHTSSLAPLLRRAVHHLPDATDADVTSSREGSKSSKICWTEDGRPKKVPDFVSVTRGPGNMSNLSVGLNTAKGLAVAWDVPLVGVHHMQAHALTPRLVSALGMKPAADTGGSKRPARGSRGTTKQQQQTSSSGSTSPEFPFLSLLVSGGHTQLVHSRSLTDHRILASTLDVALGNLLDHAAREILPPDVLAAVPDVKYGRHLEAFAFPGGGTQDEYAFYPVPTARAYELASLDSGYDWFLPCPMARDRKLAWSFSGLGSSASNIVAQISASHSSSSSSSSSPSAEVEERRALARHTFAAAFRHLAGRIVLALEDCRDLNPPPATLVVAGGVACNRFLMHVLRRTLAARGYGRMRIVVPPPALCTDNAAMIAWAGMEMYTAGWHTDLSVLAISKWPMDPDRGEGIMGAPGWLKR